MEIPEALGDGNLQDTVGPVIGEGMEIPDEAKLPTVWPGIIIGE